MLQDRSTPISQSDIRLSNILLRHFNSIHDIVLVPRSQVPTVVLFVFSNLECQSAQFPSGKHGVSQSREHTFAARGSAAQQLVVGRLAVHPVPLCSSATRRLTRSFPFGSYKNSNILSNIHNGIFKKDDPAFEKLSAQAKQLIYRFFDCEASKRITLDELIASDFMKIQDSQDEPDFISNWERLTFVGYSLQDSCLVFRSL